MLVSIRFFSPEDDRICEGNVLIKHGNPSSNGSGLICSWGNFLEQLLLSSNHSGMKIIADFANNQMMSSQYTCDGAGHFPVLTIEDIPTTVKSLALIVDDPDAPASTRDHLLLANVPVESSDITITQDTFIVWMLWQNSWWEQAWWWPCPPSGTHRYFFKVYALSEMLDISVWFSKKRLLELMQGKIIEQAEIVGLYKRQ